MRSHVGLVALVVAAAATADARQSSRDPGQGGPRSRVAGIVVSAEDGRQPIRRAMVTLEGPSAMSQLTDEDGRFAFEDVLGGDYDVTATRAAFLPASYGARRPGRLPSRLSVAAGAAIGDVTLFMSRGAAIEGTVRDFSGEPASNVGVVVAPAGDIPMMFSILGSPWTTDDRGTYRAYGLAPGSYVVFAVPTVVRRGEIVQPSTTSMDAALRALTDQSPTAAPAIPAFDQTVAYGPVFHPGSPTIEHAGVITVAAGDERQGIDVTLMLVPTRAIDGIVLDAAGQPATPVQLFISGNGTPNPLMFDAAPILTGRSTTLGAGRFRYTNVTAGRYTITAKRPAAPALWAQVDVDVSTANVTGLELRLRPALTVSGRVYFNGTTPAPANLASVRLTLAPPTGSGGGMGNQTNYGLGTSMVVNADDDGLFQMTGVIPGEYVASAFIPGNSPATGWWLRSVTINGVNAVDLPATIGDSSPGDVVFTFSDRHTELSGTLSSPAGQPTAEYYIVAMPADRALWRANSRRMRIARPSTAGRYVFTDLPPGEYLIAAVTDFAESDFRDRQMLDQVATAAMPIALGDGAKVIQDIRIR
jgi:hypothetical protein